MYAQQIPAFKDIIRELVAFSSYCQGRIALEQGNELSPFITEDESALLYRTKISSAYTINRVFLDAESKDKIITLVNNISGLCNGELANASGQEDFSLASEYSRMQVHADKLISELYISLNL